MESVGGSTYIPPELVSPSSSQLQLPGSGLLVQQALETASSKAPVQPVPSAHSPQNCRMPRLSTQPRALHVGTPVLPAPRAASLQITAFHLGWESPSQLQLLHGGLSWGKCLALLGSYSPACCLPPWLCGNPSPSLRAQLWFQL